MEQTAKPSRPSTSELAIIASGRRLGADVVPGFQLVELIKQFCETWERDRPSGNFHGWEAEEDTSAYFGPMKYLEVETERRGLRISDRYLRRIKSGEVKFVAFDRAEILVLAMEKEHLFSNGTIQVVPNPYWSQEEWLEYMAERGCA